MTFLSGVFLIFLFVLLVLYVAVDAKYRCMLLLAANYVFYAWSDPSVLIPLLLSTIVTYVGGRLLQKPKKCVYWLFFAANIGILLVCKYTGFALETLRTLLTRLSLPTLDVSWSIVAPVGLSFYIFQSSTYLSDVYRKGMAAEKNIVRYAAFVSFFPSILSGPIQRSRDLLPQLKEPPAFDFEKAKKGLVLLLWGYFVKIAVAGRLCNVVDLIYNNYADYDGIYYLVAACCFSLYIYCDFSAYSDMARGVASIFGFDICKNFNNPYLAESLSDFWNRWHMSLNNWFVENVYIPLGGNRKGTMRKYFNIMVVFLLSGAWHGASWNYVVWGAANGALRVAGEVLSPVKHKVYATLKWDESSISVVALKRLGTFFWITVTWVFFRIPHMSVAVHIIKNMLIFQPVTLFDSGLLAISGTVAQTMLLILFTTVFGVIQYCRKSENRCYLTFTKQPKAMQILILALVVAICVFSIASGNVESSTRFVYYDF